VVIKSVSRSTETACLIKAKVCLRVNCAASHLYTMTPNLRRILLFPVLYIEPDWSFLDLLHAASQRLDIIPSAEKIYNADGNTLF
jgi:hypothetical protein